MSKPEIWPDLLPLLYGAPMVLAFIVSLFFLRTPARLQRRLSRVAGNPGLNPELGTPSTDVNVRRKPTGTGLSRIEHRFGVFLPHAKILTVRLEQAGVPLCAVDLLSVLVIALVVIVTVFNVWLHVRIWISIGVGVVVLALIARFVVCYRIRKRRQRFINDLPDAIDLMVRGVRSGLPVTESLLAAGQEVRGQVGIVFQDISANIKLGKSLNESLVQAAAKLDVQEMRFLSTSLIIQQETGGNVGEILDNLSTLMRRRQQMRMKVRAMSSEARASAMIIGSLPFIMFVVIMFLDSSYMLKLFIDPRGWVLIGAGMASLGMGLTVMTSMIRFEI